MCNHLHQKYESFPREDGMVDGVCKDCGLKVCGIGNFHAIPGKVMFHDASIRPVELGDMYHYRSQDRSNRNHIIFGSKLS